MAVGRGGRSDARVGPNINGANRDQGACCSIQPERVNPCCALLALQAQTPRDDSGSRGKCAKARHEEEVEGRGIRRVGGGTRFECLSWGSTVRGKDQGYAVRRAGTHHTCTVGITAFALVAKKALASSRADGGDRVSLAAREHDPTRTRERDSAHMGCRLPL
jgi:hypothetical protein